MDVEYDPVKIDWNIKERGLAFDRARDLDWKTAHVRLDSRMDYGEQRWIALGLLDGRLHVLVFKETPMGIRVISFRKANSRERDTYEQTQTTD
jgi:uncharacterized DUF497 family protein